MKSQVMSWWQVWSHVSSGQNLAFGQKLTTLTTWPHMTPTQKEVMMPLFGIQSKPLWLKQLYMKESNLLWHICHMNESLRNFQFLQNLFKKKRKWKKHIKKNQDLLKRDHFCNPFIKFVFKILLKSTKTLYRQSALRDGVGFQLKVTIYIWQCHN